MYDEENDDLARKMLNSSFSYTNAACTDYFAQKAGSQSRLNIARSVVAPALTLLTGVLSIINIKNDPQGAKRADWEKGFSLASAATLSALTIWEENFLFSAENIDDVRSLTGLAMSEYRLSVLELKDHTFDSSIEYILQYHMICTPGRIKGLVKQAIKDKRITVVNNNTAVVAIPSSVVPAGPVGLTTPAPAEASKAGVSLIIK